MAIEDDASGADSGYPGYVNSANLRMMMPREGGPTGPIAPLAPRTVRCEMREFTDDELREHLPTLHEAQQHAEICGSCGRYVFTFEPIYLGKIRSLTGRGYYKVPHCQDCVSSEWQLWGYWNRYFTGRKLNTTECVHCGRELLGFFHDEEPVTCSQECYRKTRRH